MPASPTLKKKIIALAKTLNIPDPVTSEAIAIGSKLTKYNLVKGMASEKVATICIFIASRKYGIPISFSDLPPVKHRFRALEDIIELTGETIPRPPPPETHIEKLKDLGFTEEMIQEIKSHYERLRTTTMQPGLSKNPKALIACIAQIIAKKRNINIPRKTICKKLGVKLQTTSSICSYLTKTNAIP